MKKYVAMVMSVVFIVLAILFTVPTKVVVVGKGDGTSEKITTIESFVEAIEAMINFDFDSFVYDNASVKLLSGDSSKKYESFTSESGFVFNETSEHEEYIDKDGKIVVDIYNEGVDVDELQKITVKIENSIDVETKVYFTQTGIYMDCTANWEQKDKYVDTDQSFYSNVTGKVQMYLSCEGEFFINLEQFAVSGDNVDEIIGGANFESVLSLVGKKWIQVNHSEDLEDLYDVLIVVIQPSLSFADSLGVDCRLIFKYMDRYINTDAILKQDKQYSINSDYFYHASTFLNWGSFDKSVNWSEIAEICSSCGLDSGIFDGCQTYGEVCDLLLPYYDVLYKSSTWIDYNLADNLSLKVDLSDSISPMYSFGVEGSDGYKFSSKTKITNINNTVCKFDKSTVRYSVDFDELFGDE